MRLSLEQVASELRAIALATPENDFIGSEEMLVDRLKSSRATVRQAARHLEKEGLLYVRRGFNGGYFASRPGLATVEAIASSYLQSIEVNLKHVNMIATTLWTEVVREAAQLRTDAARSLAQHWINQINALPKNIAFPKIIEFEQRLRGELFALIGARYFEMIFHINATLGGRGAFTRGVPEGPELDVYFRNWRGAKLGELQAIVDGDAELAAIAARHTSNVLQSVYRDEGGRPRT